MSLPADSPRQSRPVITVSARSAAADEPVRPQRRTAAERNFRRTAAPPAPMKEFRSILSPRRSAVSAPATFTAGSGRAAAAMQTLEALPHVMAGMSALAGMPEEKPRVAGRFMLCWGLGLFGTLAAIVAVFAGRESYQPEAIDAGIKAERVAVAERRATLEETVQGFFHATTPEEKTRFVRGGAAMLPAMQAYYASHPDEPASVSGATGAPYRDDAGEFLFVRAVVDSAAVTFMMEPGPAGALIDWRSLTGVGDMPWAEWLGQKPAHPVAMRAWVSLDDYYAGEFMDSDRFLCLKIASPDGNMTAWAYAERSSIEAAGLQKVLGAPPAGGVAENTIRPRTRLLGTFAFPQASGAGAPLPQVRLISLSEGGWLDRQPGSVALR